MNIRFDVLRALSQVVISISNVFDRQEPFNSNIGFVLTDSDSDKDDFLNGKLLLDIAEAQATLAKLEQLLVNIHNSRYRSPLVSPMSRGTQPLAEREQAFSQKFAELQKAYHMYAEIRILMDMKTREHLIVPPPILTFADSPQTFGGASGSSEPWVGAGGAGNVAGAGNSGTSTFSTGGAGNVSVYSGGGGGTSINAGSSSKFTYGPDGFGAVSKDDDK